MLWFLGLFFLLLCFYNFYWKRRLLPPGPIPLPLIGNYHEVEANPPGYATFDKWRKKYGEIHTFWLAETPVVSINDFSLIQKYFVKENSDTLAGRMLVGRQMEIQRGGTFGLIFVDGVQWREHRRFALQVFRNFGMGRGLMEEKIQIEISNMFDDINEAFGNSKEITIEPAPLFEITVANIINQLLFGFGYHDKKGKQEFSKVKDCIAKMMRFACSPSINLIYSFYPLRHLPFLKQKLAEFTEVEQFISNYCQKQVEAHKTAMKNSNGRKLDPQDYVEAYLQEAENRKDDFSEKQLKYVIFDMWVAGQETTANTLIFSLLYLLHNPNVQEKIHAELDTVIGSDRRITLADKSSLIYANAFINEVQRSVNLLPMNLLHKTLNDVQIGNYLIKKDTAIVPQISAVMFDEKIFPEPHKFKPERFIDAKGELKKVEELVPFSIGKRQCLGESLARMELFLFVSNFYNLYKVAPIDPSNLPSLDKIPGVTIQPKQFSCNFIKRF